MTDALTMISTPGYAFTRTWFKKNEKIWINLFETTKPARVLEIGSFEGYSACWMIAQSAVMGATHFEIHCVDTWEGGVEHQPGASEEVRMADVAKRFEHNIATAKQRTPLRNLQVHPHKTLSHLALAKLIAEGRLGYFDVIYVDGSHQAPDVLTDAVMSFPLLKVDGIMVFDDYLWSVDGKGDQDILNMPKPAVDAFANLFMRKMTVMRGGTREQLFLRKYAD